MTKVVQRPIHRTRTFKAIALLTFCLSLLPLGFWAGRLSINVSDSMPVGVWHLTAPEALDESLRGRIVVFCPSADEEIFQKAKAKGILRDGTCDGSYMPLLKEVVGVPGDVIEYSDGFTVNGLKLPNSQILALDLDGAQLPIFRRLVVPEGKLWLMSSYSGLSFDSRYFGFINSNSIRGIADPLLVAE